jgi:hypothetical protein
LKIGEKLPIEVIQRGDWMLDIVCILVAIDRIMVPTCWSYRAQVFVPRLVRNR